MNNLQTNDDHKSEKRVTLYQLLLIIYKHLTLIICLTFLGMGSALIYSFQLPNVYTSSALLTLTRDDASPSSSSSQTNTLANLAGINLGMGDSKTQEILARMNSYNFFQSLILPLIKMENLIAVESWDSKNNQIIYDSSMFDEELGTWVIPEPSSQTGHKKFMKTFLAGSDDLTKFMKLTLEHESPVIAKKWLDEIIRSINTVYREETQKKASRSLLFLNKKMALSNSSEIKSSLAFLIQKQTQTLMMAEENENYIVTGLELPIVSEKKSGPNRVLNIIFGTMIGFIFGIFLSLLIEFYRAEKALSNHKTHS
jgi:capsular polysaccharide biosynthesis protein